MLHKEMYQHIADAAAYLSMQIFKLGKTLPLEEATAETIRDMLRIAEYSLDNAENYCIRLAEEK